MTTIDTDEFRTLLEAGARAPDQRRRLPRAGEPRARSRTSSARSAERRHGQPPRRHRVGDVRPRARPGARGGRAADARRDRRGARSASRTARYGICEVCGKPIGAERLRARSRGRRSASTTSARVRGESRTRRHPGRLVDERARTGLRRGALARAPGAWQWAGLGAVALAAVIADQVTKHVVTRTLRARRLGARRRAALDPPRPELRHRLRALLERDGGRHARDRRSPSSGCSSSSRAPARATRCCPRRSGC